MKSRFDYTSFANVKGAPGFAALVPRRFAIVNANILTMDKAQPRAEALLVDNDRIVRVGEERAILRAARGAPSLDTQGKAVLPGIIDAHTHLIHQGLLKTRLDLRETKSLAQALDAVRQRVARTRVGGLVLAERWDESRWKERRYPTLQELDEISKRHPIILRRVDGHIAVANTPACEIVAKKLPGVDPLTGLLVEEASLNLNQILPTPPSESVDALQVAQKEALRLGVTTVHDFVVPSYLRAYQTLHHRRRLYIRAHVTPYVEYLDQAASLGLQTGWGDERLRLGGIKLFADGSLGGHTAALRSPYRDERKNNGRLNWTSLQLEQHFRRANASGLQVSAHAIGDAAIDQVLDAYKAVGRRGRTLRHRIEHFELHHPDHDVPMRDLGLVASMQPNFVGEWSRPGGMYHARLGPRRARHNNEFRRLRDAGVRVAFGSDCMPFDPWFGLAATVGAPYASQRLTPEDALAAYTRDSAWSIQRDHDLGSLRAGYKADLVLVDWQKPTARNIARTRLEATFVDGRAAHVSKPLRFR